MDQKYLLIPIDNPIYNFVQIFYLSAHNLMANFPIEILVTNIHFVILLIADTTIFGQYIVISLRFLCINGEGYM